MRIETGKRVLDFARSLPPTPRRALRLALRRLSDGKGDIRPLQGELAGFYRLRVTTYRVIFHYVQQDAAVCLRCVFAESRDAVYPLFYQLLNHGQLED